ncbi:hypothetical protein [Flagellimonas allohymeniacidonis]|uniref:Uncharacterized protein n=1 Tax=Flagellimonas allohymeniacidonis TaxID=2517819 RepID=A0A4V2HSZ3_9FLAO|nr:hypothetical protein [Allomuricauda hymeniacidonis]TAI49640.1 hypothetical protein EW142_07540 [Allomuricauda hymeniacidonis]
MKLTLSAGIALFLSVASLTVWEIYWRSQGRIPTIDDDKHLWAAEREKVDQLGPDDIVIVGSSRVMFDIQLDEFEELSGVRPIQLACAGSSPLPVFHDIVENTDFSGTVIVGVTPPLFFSTTFPKAPPIEWPQSRVDHHKKWTYAQRFNHWLSMPLQKNLVMVATHDEVLDDNVDLKTLLNNVEINNRTKKPRYPPFFEFGYIDDSRNVRMAPQMTSDTTAANQIKGAWEFVFSGKNPPPDKNGTTAFFAKDAEKLRERGGNAVFVRCPSTGIFHEGEKKITPRETFYDSLLTVTKFPGYHYQDYEELRNFDCPEWSHLSEPDAKKFTKALVKIMLKDKVITNLKTD